MKQKYYLDINGDKVEVTEEIYTEYMRAKWREENQKRRDRKRNSSLEELKNNGQEVSDYYNIANIVEDLFIKEELRKIILQLTKEEQKIIHYKFYFNKTEREIANRLNLSQSTIHRRLIDIYKKIKFFIEK